MKKVFGILIHKKRNFFYFTLETMNIIKQNNFQMERFQRHIIYQEMGRYHKWPHLYIIVSKPCLKIFHSIEIYLNVSMFYSRLKVYGVFKYLWDDQHTLPFVIPFTPMLYKYDLRLMFPKRKKETVSVWKVWENPRKLIIRYDGNRLQPLVVYKTLIDRLFSKWKNPINKVQSAILHYFRKRNVKINNVQ